MDKLLFKEIAKQVNHLYQNTRSTLLDPQSYQTPAKETLCLNNVERYFDFLENALQRDYLRLNHLHHLFKDGQYAMADRMYPFCWLRESTKAQLQRWYYQAKWLVEGLDTVDSKAANQLMLEDRELEELGQRRYLKRVEKMR